MFCGLCVPRCSVSQCVAVCCSVSQSVAGLCVPCCSVLQCVAECCRFMCPASPRLHTHTGVEDEVKSVRHFDYFFLMQRLGIHTHIHTQPAPTPPLVSTHTVSGESCSHGEFVVLDGGNERVTRLAYIYMNIHIYIFCCSQGERVLLSPDEQLAL